MKKFTFELEDVLTYRKFEEENAQSELAKAMLVETEIQNKLDQLALSYATVTSQMKNSKNFDDLYSQNRFNKLIELQKEELLNELSKAKLVSDEKRKVLQDIMTKTQALEKLKDQQYSEYKEQIEYEENEMLEDIISAKYHK